METERNARAQAPKRKRRIPMEVSLVSLIIPVFNEEENLSPLHAEIAEKLADFPWDYEVIYIDDGSQDASWQRLREIHAIDPRHVRLIRLRRNFGQTAAMAAGFDAALGDIVVPMDADQQNDPADIRPLVEKALEGHDVVCGWRASRKDALFSRRLPSVLANRLISSITRIRLHDYGCTLKAFRKSVSQDIHLYGEMHRFLPALAALTGARVTELRVNHRPRLRGKGKYGMDRVVRVVLDLITVKFLLSYSTRPMQIFGRWGFYSFLFGITSGLIMAIRKFMPPYEDVTGTPWLYLSIFFFLSGFQMIGMGLLGEINVRTYFETQRKPIYSVWERVERDQEGTGAWKS
jgi:glycosyltransferase involved in cell wall biosynthesis